MYFKIGWIWIFFSLSVKILSYFYFQEICHKNGKPEILFRATYSLVSFTNFDPN